MNVAIAKGMTHKRQKRACNSTIIENELCLPAVFNVIIVARELHALCWPGLIFIPTRICVCVIYSLQKIIILLYYQDTGTAIAPWLTDGLPCLPWSCMIQVQL